jgi:hypothetical protein
MPDRTPRHTPEPGATVGDHLPRAAVPTALAVAAAATYPRLRAGLESIVAPVHEMGATVGRGALALTEERSP